MIWLILLALACVYQPSIAFPYEDTEVPWNLNANQHASNPLEYTAVAWEDHTYHPSPENWRFPFYSFMIDRFVNGDPTNDDSNGTAWEYDHLGTQLRAGGDAQGIVDSLDYLYAMGIRGIYLVGSVMINLPWQSDQYSIVDHTILDHHLGNISVWRSVIDAVHAKGMYVLLDNTMATMGNQLAFTDFQNTSAPFSVREHDVEWKSERQYVDWSFGNEELAICDVPYPRFWDEDGRRIHDNYTESMTGCRDSEFDQYGDIGAFDIAPEWRKQLSKFGGVQDRLREWKPSVLEKIEHFSCMMITALDFDGFRMDKGMQISVDAQGNFSAAMRQCAKQVGKSNFFVTGEIVSGNTNGAIYIGRGKEPEMAFTTVDEAFSYGSNLSTVTAEAIRAPGYSAFDSAAFHYSIYRAFVHILGVNGHLTAPGDTSTNFAEAWTEMVLTNDLSNAYTGGFDPRHLYGVENQDTFRWSGTEMGPARHGLGSFIVTLVLPGIPLVSWGEEQAFYTLDSTAPNYLYGRQPMSSSQAWQMHGCYKVGDDTPARPVFNSTLQACEDDSISLDHRDQSHPKYNIYKMMFEMRERYPVLNDGWMLQQLSNATYQYTLPDANDVPTEVGLYSVVRSRFPDLQDFSGAGQGNTDVWMLYSNLNYTRVFESPCSSRSATLAPFAAGTTVKNLFWPFDEYTLQRSRPSSNLSCVPSINMTAYSYKAFVPFSQWLSPTPHITRFSPGHDARLLSGVSPSSQEHVPVSFDFSHEMDCDSVAAGMSVSSTTADGSVAALDKNTIDCSSKSPDSHVPLPGAMPGAWTFSANLVNVSNGVHVVSIENVSASAAAGGISSSGLFKFTFRIGQADNPIVFQTANYSSTLFFRETENESTASSRHIAHKANGADLFRYTTNWGSSWSPWQVYENTNTTVEPLAWTGTTRQKWGGEHIQVQYWSRATGSSSHFQEGDLFEGSGAKIPRRFPHAFIHGPFNSWGYDAGFRNDMWQDEAGLWNWDLMTEWPAQFQVNGWGMNPDGLPDMTRAYGDIDNDTVLDRLSPSTLQESVVNVTDMVGASNMGPPSPYLAWRLQVNDGNLRYTFVPVGSRWAQMVLFILCATVPLLTAVATVTIYRWAFYKVKFNTVGLSEKLSLFSSFKRITELPFFSEKHVSRTPSSASSPSATHSPSLALAGDGFFGLQQRRRTVMIATIEYDIEDWDVKVKIGGLGVMAQLMSKNLRHQDLIWVVPCPGGIDFPVDTPLDPIAIKIMGQQYSIQVQQHKLNNVTYLLLDAPIFRSQTKSDPYPARMDDLHSAIYYSAWNQCIAEAMKRFHVDLYHINDYHGTLAPLYLLPEKTVPCCLSLHNAEFQGLWPCRTPKERQEIGEVFNLPQSVIQNYVQFGQVFNLLHAGASILRIHQDGFGAVGVSNKYGKRSYARYPIFWGLKRVGALPNPDPTDLDDWDKRLNDPKQTIVDQEFEARRPELKRQAQEWAGLEQRADADLFVFVGRWSMQKGIDLIADVFPAVLEKYPHVQLLCIGPVIDLYGKFAALKLQKMMEKYPGRVYSKPEFTALPPFVFTGAEFALIPSRDEPFGLVAVEFGRKGALGVGARVGGLGQVPGWWYTVESMTTKHLVHQFKDAIQKALKSQTSVRATMRARSAKTRFPVQQWKEDLEILQSGSIRAHDKHMEAIVTPSLPWRASLRSGSSTPRLDRAIGQAPRGPASGWSTPAMIRSPQTSVPGTREPSPSRQLNAKSMGSHVGPSRYLSMGYLRSAFSSREGSRNTSRAASPERSSHETSSRSGSGSVQQANDSADERSRQHPRTIAGITESIPKSADKEGLREHGPEDVFGVDAGTLLQESAGPVSSHGGTAVSSPPPVLLQEQGCASWDFAQISRHRQPHEEDTELGLSVPSSIRFPSSQRQSPAAQSPQSNTPDVHIPGAQTPHSVYSHDASLEDVRLRHTELELSLEKVLAGRDTTKQQDLTPFFTDPTGRYYRAFEAGLEKLNAKTSESSLCIEEYLVESEKHWFSRLHTARMAPIASRATTPAASMIDGGRDVDEDDDGFDQFLLPETYEPPKGLSRILASNIHRGGWPIYTFLLALGQILAANSYQITLLTGQIGQPATKLYVVACIYLTFSIVWWVIFRRFKAIYVICLPWGFYGLAFFFLGVSPYGKTVFARGWIQDAAVGLYAVASAAGSFFFAQNFGSQGAQPVKTWGFRACAIQGTQQIYIIALWYWGSTINVRQSNGITSTITNWRMTAISMPIAIVLWAIGIMLFIGLPDFYRQDPGAIPSFYRSTLRRRIILWFFVAVALQTYFLSATYGRNWAYLWSSKHAPAWAIVVLIVFFFILVWAVALAFFSYASVTHSWILPIFAIGLGAPRWCQMLWSTSNIGMYLPWAGGPVASALVGRGLWLWLGILDALQGVGFGMILLQTLTRIHLTFSLVAAQCIGSVFTILARATASNKLGPGDVFPDFSATYDGLRKGWFWAGLIAQLIVCVGFLKFFRKDQLSKP